MGRSFCSFVVVFLFASVAISATCVPTILYDGVVSSSAVFSPSGWPGTINPTVDWGVLGGFTSPYMHVEGQFADTRDWSADYVLPSGPIDLSTGTLSMKFEPQGQAVEVRLAFVDADGLVSSPISAQANDHTMSVLSITTSSVAMNEANATRIAKVRIILPSIPGYQYLHLFFDDVQVECSAQASSSSQVQSSSSASSSSVAVSSSSIASSSSVAQPSSSSQVGGYIGYSSFDEGECDE